MRDKTLLFLHKPNKQQILLAMKKRGFGEGKWNGVGGKVEDGESVEGSVLRETMEEIGVRVQREQLRKVAELTFYHAAKPEWDCLVHTYFVETWEAEPTETEEMRPEWHHHNDIPYHSMWEDDQHWLPRVLAGEFVCATFHFDESGVLSIHTMHE
jgi:8-oxo-dGTP pyrophosphatase MutT (NUDIX family)